jgi:predicted secreted protein
MSIPLAIALYFVIWWTTLFAILPIGVRTQGEAGDVVPGTPRSAPVRPRILWIIGVNTVTAAAVFVLIVFAVNRGWIPLESGATDVPAGAVGKR